MEPLWSRGGRRPRRGGPAVTAQANAAVWTAGGAAAALAAVAAVAAAVAAAPGIAPVETGAQHDAGAREDGSGGEAGAGGVGADRPDPDIVMPSKSSRPGCEIDDACYIPALALVSAGDSVTWQNGDVAFHTVTSGEYGSPDGVFDSGHLDPGEFYTMQFAEAGVVKYHCTLHPWMHGSVVVMAAGAAPAEPAG